MDEATILRTAQPKRHYTTPATTPLQAARRVCDLLNDTYAFLGEPGERWAMEQAIVHKHSDGDWMFDYSAKVLVYWEGGPYESMFNLTGYQDVYQLLDIDRDKVFMECNASFVLGFYKAN